MRFSFLLVGVWWFGFAQYSFANLPKDPKARPIQSDILSKGYRELKTVWKQLQSQPSLKMYLIAFLFFNMAVQTVMYLATLFGVQEIAWPDEESKQSSLIVCILLIQFVAMVEHFCFLPCRRDSETSKHSIVSIVVWMLICTAVYKFVYVPFNFYLTAAFVGMVMGGIQSLSRSTYSKLLPPTNDHASSFSFYDVCDKVGTVLGTFIFGYINEITGSMRQSIVALIVFFIIDYLCCVLTASK